MEKTGQVADDASWLRQKERCPEKGARAVVLRITYIFIILKKKIIGLFKMQISARAVLSRSRVAPRNLHLK